MAQSLQYLEQISTNRLTEVKSVDQAIQQDSENRPPADREKDLTLLQVMGSVFAAGFGVQSKENKVRDFTRGKPVHFIIAGLVFTIAFLVALIVVVNMVV